MTAHDPAPGGSGRHRRPDPSGPSRPRPGPGQHRAPAAAAGPTGDTLLTTPIVVVPAPRHGGRHAERTTPVRIAPAVPVPRAPLAARPGGTPQRPGPGDGPGRPPRHAAPPPVPSLPRPRPGSGPGRTGAAARTAPPPHALRPGAGTHRSTVAGPAPRTTVRPPSRGADPAPRSRRESAAPAVRPTVLTELLTGRWSVALAATVVGLVALAVRTIGVQTSFELWVDEMLYGDLGASVARGELPNLPDGPFFLHPPGYFLVEGAVIRLLGLSGDSMTLVYQLRWIGVVLGALTVAVLYLLVRRLAGPVAAVLCAGVLAFEPFVLRNNSRVFLETSAGLASLVGILLLVRAMRLPHGRERLVGLLAAGLAMGFGVLTKDIFAVFTAGPVVLAVLWRRTLARRDAAVVLGMTVLPYLAYLLVLTAAGELQGWVTAKSAGVLRLLGLVQSTGFNAPDAPSLLGRIVDLVGHYGTSYLLLLAGPVAGLHLCWAARRADRRIVGLVAVCMGGFGTYSALFGTFEEQYGYGVVLAAVVAVGVAVVEIRERRPHLGRTLLAGGLAFLLLTTALGLRAELVRDNGFRDLRAWVDTRLPADARVGVTNSTGELAFAHDPRFGVWPTPGELLANGAGYVLTQSLPTRQGYGYAQPELLDWLAANAQPVFRSTGLTNGETVLWQVGRAQLEQGAADAVGTPGIEEER